VILFGTVVSAFIFLKRMSFPFHQFKPFGRTCFSCKINSF